MKKLYLFYVIIGLFLYASCGNDDEAKLSEKGKLLTSVTWKYDTNASISGVTDDIKDTTGITADIELKDDVKAIADFLTGTLRFGIDSRDPSKLSYERKYGKGIFSTSVLGYWNFNDDETAVIMREWDSQAGKEKPAETYKIIELSENKLVLQKEGEAANVYVPDK